MLFGTRTQRKISSQQLSNSDLSIFAGMFGLPSSDIGSIAGTSALKEITVYTCIKILSEAIGKLPLKIYKITNNDKDPITDDYRCFLLSTRPNSYMSAFEFWRVMEVLRNLYGNAYAYIDVATMGRNAGKIQGLYPLNSERMKVYVDDAGLINSSKRVWYAYQDDQGKEYVLNSDSVLHFKGLSTNGLIGLSTIETLRASIENAKASSTFLNNSYRSGMQSAGVLQYTGGLDAAGEAALRAKFEAMTSGLVNANRLAVMPIGLSYQALGIKLTDAQFLENSNFTIQQLTAAFGIKPHQVNDQKKTSYASTAEANREFYTDTLLGVLTMYEQENTYKLFTQSENESGWYAKFDTNVLLRADTEKRFTMYKDAVQNMLKTPNECRALEEDGPLPGGDILYGNAALAPATMLAEGIAYKKGGEAE